MPLYLIIFLASLAESLVSFTGGMLVFLNEERIRRFTHFVISFAVGALLGVSFLELIPEAVSLSSLEFVMPWVLAGAVFFFILEKLLFWYHCHGGVCSVHTYNYLILWGDFLHNFVDGIIIALAFLVDIKLGILTATAVIFHEIPQEVGDFGLLLHGGFSRQKALFYNFLVSLSTIAGAMLTYSAGSFLEPFLPVAIAVVAGNFLYLAFTDLMPELHESTGFGHAVIQIVLIVAGTITVILPEFIFS